jgi:hypothetical protein
VFNYVILDELNKEKIICFVGGGSIQTFITKGRVDSDIDIFFPGNV